MDEAEVDAEVRADIGGTSGSAAIRARRGTTVTVITCLSGTTNSTDKITIGGPGDILEFMTASDATLGITAKKITSTMAQP